MTGRPSESVGIVGLRGLCEEYCRVELRSTSDSACRAMIIFETIDPKLSVVESDATRWVKVCVV